MRASHTLTPVCSCSIVPEHTHTLGSSWVPWSPSNLHLSNLTGGTNGEESLIHKASGHLYYTRRNRPLDFCRPWIYHCCISLWHHVICLAVLYVNTSERYRKILSSVTQSAAGKITGQWSFMNRWRDQSLASDRNKPDSLPMEHCKPRKRWVCVCVCVHWSLLSLFI